MGEFRGDVQQDGPARFALIALEAINEAGGDGRLC